MKRFLKKTAIVILALITVIPFFSICNGYELSPIDTATGVINNSYWGIYADNSVKASSNAVNITKALNWAKENGISSVRLETGVYYVNGVYGYDNKNEYGIRLPSGIDFDLGGSTLIQPANSSPFYSVIIIKEQSNATVRNGTIIGDKDSHDYAASSASHEFGFGVSLWGCENINLIQLNISKMTGDAILINGNEVTLANGGKISKNIKIQSCELFDCRRQGVSITGADGVDIDCVNIHDIVGTMPESGIDMEAELDWTVKNVLIHNSTFKNCKSAAVIFHIGSESCTLENNVIDGIVSVIYGSNHIIRNNIISNQAIYNKRNAYNTLIENNYLINSFINSCNNKNACIVGNTLTGGGYIIFNYSSGVVANNILVNNGSAKYLAVQIYADGQRGDDVYKVYFIDNAISGNYTIKAQISSWYNKLIIIDEAASS